MSVLLDTGVLLRVFVKADPAHGAICRAIRHFGRSSEEMVTSFQNLAEFCNVSTRPVATRGGYGITIVKAGLRATAVERLCRLIFEDKHSYALWRRLITRYNLSGVAMHDARLIALMLSNNIEKIFTLNERDFRRYEPEGIEIVTPQTLLPDQD